MEDDLGPLPLVRQVAEVVAENLKSQKCHYYHIFDFLDADLFPDVEVWQKIDDPVSFFGFDLYDKDDGDFQSIYEDQDELKKILSN